MSTRTALRWVVPCQNEARVEEFPVPDPGPGQVMVRTEASLVSAGTELAIYTGIHQGLTNPDCAAFFRTSPNAMVSSASLPPFMYSRRAFMTWGEIASVS